MTHTLIIELHEDLHFALRYLSSWRIVAYTPFQIVDVRLNIHCLVSSSKWRLGLIQIKSRTRDDYPSDPIAFLRDSQTKDNTGGGYHSNPPGCIF